MIRAAAMARPQTAVQALLAVLEAEGVECIFGVPGGPLTAIFEALGERPSIRFVLAKHEEGAALMAATYARVRGTLAVCCVTSGPGATNAVTGIASAYTESLPVLFLTGQVSTKMFARGAIQESTAHGIDLVQLFKPITKLSTLVPSGDLLPRITREAIRQSLSVRPGPVHLSLPSDILTQSVAPLEGTPRPASVTARTVDQEAAREVARELLASERACILAGNGVSLSGAHEELLQLAERLSLPVCTTPKGKGCFPESHPLSLGLVGLGGHLHASAFIEEGVETLLVVGSALGEFATSSWDVRLQPQRALMQIDHDAGVIGRNYPVDLAVVGDARAALRCILDELPPGLVRHTDPLLELRQEVPRHESAELLDSDETPIKPQRLIRELRAAMPDDGMLFVDNGNSIMWAGHYFEARMPGTYFIDLGVAAMGSACAGVIGGKLAAPSRTAVALVGDAAFAMNGMEVHTAVELGLGITWVVLNNQGHGMVAHGERLLRGRHLGFARFATALDVAGIAAGLGALAFRVDSPAALRAALDEALASGRPCVIDALIDDSVVPPTLARRAQALSRSFTGPQSTRIPTALPGRGP